MTDTTPTTEVSDNSTGEAVGTLEHLDPHTLILDTNVRDEADLDAQFVASI
jgi:ParB family transcriptional regulator, chromosome partitioning protein